MKGQRYQSRVKWIAISIGLLLLLTLLASCGGATSSGTSSSEFASTSKNSASDTSSQNQKSANGTSQTNTNYTPQYLIKQLAVTMEAKETTNIANDLQNWITHTDPQSTSSGMQYQLVGNAYNITMTFSVQSSLYTAIRGYLVDYPSKHDGRLLSLNETVKNATNDYIDTQSRLKNLRTEQQRLQDLMKNAQSMSDLLSIESKLSEVEGQIEQAEGTLKSLDDQTTFYPVTITIQPPYDGSTAITEPSNTWNIGQITHDALQASLHFFQFLVSILIWLLAFSVYIIPAAILIWLVRRWRKQHRSQPFLASSPMKTPQRATIPYPDHTASQSPMVAEVNSQDDVTNEETAQPALSEESERESIEEAASPKDERPLTTGSHRS
ncbi:DUF4349 domain-containing protein [Ktedonospora formicarum]|uniref:DUF4349 domain-containing protein n=1 Tax=Ktedonospora formicarum TaxID=2778364 RepID=A0A8J3I0N4_9CHLR|nr:DUF4349 domain-containing protein [Ktedonospora formicarum]GHO42729.1 hypothetical protein KSX_08920 [Ktedonospora formicarum]